MNNFVIASYVITLVIIGSYAASIALRLRAADDELSTSDGEPDVE